MPSTMIIIPAMNMIVAQLMPALLSSAAPDTCQNSRVNILLRFSVVRIASRSLITKPNTTVSVRKPQPSVT